MENLAIAAQEAVIFLERKHHDTRDTMALDTHRMKHRLVGVISKLARNLLGRNSQKRFRHIALLDFALPE